MDASARASHRVIELDALRGLAVIGIVWMNVYVFALAAQAYYNPIAWGGDQLIDRLVWATSFIFIEDKFRTLFAMMFGAGCFILLERSSTRPWRAHSMRMAVLFAIGAMHATVLANNDVLRAYALAGLAIPLVAQLTPRALVAISVGLVILHVGGGIITFGAALFDWYQQRLNSDMLFFAENNFGANPAAVEYSLEQGKESLSERVSRRVDGFAGQVTNITGSIPINLAAMVLGIALWKDGMLAGEWRLFRMQRLAAICALVAFPPLMAMAWWVSAEGFPGALVGPASLILSAPFDMVLGLAYAALAIALFRTSGVVTKTLASVGRLSLTNYLMTSILLAAIFASWGLGLFGEVSRSQAFALSFVPIAGMLLWSPVWVKQMGQGPAERLWRKASKLLS